MDGFIPFADSKNRPQDGEVIEVKVPAGICRATYDGIDGVIQFEGFDDLFDVEEYADQTWWRRIEG